MNLSMYFRRGSWETDEEYQVACDIFPNVVTERTLLPKDSLVIPRYSVLPYPHELDKDLLNLGCSPINRFWQHEWVADIWNWYLLLADITPKTWETWHNLPEGYSYVVKGRTNSRKFEWNTRMFCPTRDDVPRVAASLLDDTMLAYQGLVVREYVPLKQFGIGLNGLPITNEWRVFCLGTNIFMAGYYWADSPECAGDNCLPKKAYDVVYKASKVASEFISFFVVDVAETATGEWIIMELNDACMSGLSCINPITFYKNLKRDLMEWTT
jgi:hypothetical protein